MKFITPLLMLAGLSAFAQNPTAEQQVLRSLSFGVAPSFEGIPGKEEEPSNEDLRNREFNLSQIITRTLTRANHTGLQHYEQAAARIMANQENNPMEIAPRLVINRAVDVVKGIVQWSGQNPDLIRQWLTQFYRFNFQMALMYINNPTHTVSETFPRAKVGIDYAGLLWKFQAGLSSDTAKGILLVKIVQYLKQDLNMDTSRRNPKYVTAYQDILALQEDSIAYRNVIESLNRIVEELKNHEKLTPIYSRDVVTLRSELDLILSPLKSMMGVQ